MLARIVTGVALAVVRSSLLQLLSDEQEGAGDNLKSLF